MQAISGFTERRDCGENHEKNLQGEGEGVRVWAVRARLPWHLPVKKTHHPMKTNTKPYKGYYVTSFALRQLGDPECTGTSYSVYCDEAAYRSGQEPLSARECLFTFADAKQFIATVSKEGIL